MNTEDPAASDLGALVDAELEPGERVIWSGQPIPSRYARMTLPIVLFGIPWTAFALFWMAGASGFKVPDFSKGFDVFPLFGIPFVLIGFGLLSSPFWTGRKARRTAYVLTDRRAFTLDGHAWRGFTVRSFAPGRLTDLKRTQYPDGSGNLIFARQYRADSDGAQHSTEVGFFAIHDVKHVESLIRDLVNRSRISDD